MREDPPLDARCKDKFLVQSVAVPADQDTPAVRKFLQKLTGLTSPKWAELEKNNKSTIQERKIRVQYISTTSHANGVDENGDDSMVSPPPQYTPRAISGAEQEGSPSHDNEKAHEQGGTPSPSDYARAESATEPPRTAAGEALGAGAGTGSSREELLERLRDAEATIARLRREMDERALRRRKGDTAGADSLGGGAVPGLAVRTESGEVGVPLRVVFILCLVVFILTWLLF
jgi:hypothetical protein